MSSDGYFDDDFDELLRDEDALQQLDAIEASQLGPALKTVTHRAPTPISIESSDYEDSFDFDESALNTLDKAIEDAYKAPPPPPVQRSSSRNTLQTTLFGQVLQPSTSKPKSTAHSRAKPLKPQEPRKTKQWDHTEWAKSGVKSAKGKGKGKEKQRADEDEDFSDEDEEQFEQFPAPFISGDWVSDEELHELAGTDHSKICLRFDSPPPPMKIKPDLLDAKHWIFPLNRSKRDYQFDIVKNALFENTIVALPTGLGKTFIAGVIMLNYYRWFPEGKVVFVAPTKPLVAQQIDACHEACGIPGSDAAELTGQIPKPTRNKYWAQKRVFYMTPQTLINDLQSENCDPLDIVLIVVDEAHRATGDYAYNQVIRFMMAKNPHFRVLALTATPGSTQEAVQNLIDGLHISRIEMRAEKDVEEYIHEKKIEQHIIHMSPEINRIKDLLVKLMDKFFKPIVAAGAWRGTHQLARLHPYAAQARARGLDKNQKYLFNPLYTLATFARHMGYLMEGTIKMCHDALEEYAREADGHEGMKPSEKAAATRAKKIKTDPLFLNVIAEIRAQSLQGFTVHPKMEKMKLLIIEHFGARMEEDGDAENGTTATKAMVFVTHRAAVDEIVEELNKQKPLIRATPFIGQGTDKKGKKGLAQREQLEVIRKFKDNEYNVLVATSIGEEGLDIGEVDLAICYDTQKTPIRMLQRLGRTGRKRQGFVHVLLAEGREEQNLDKAQASYEEVQASILHGANLEFYADVERLLPDNVQPQCLEQMMEIEPYVREEGRKKRGESGTSLKKGVKRKRDDDIGRNIPQGASAGFVIASKLLVKGKGKAGKKTKKVREPKDFDQLGEDDEDDLDLQSGILGAPPLLKKSKTASSPKPKAKPLRKSKTLDPEKPKKKKVKEPTELTASQFQAKGRDDSDDMDIEQGILPISPKCLPPAASVSPGRGSSVRAVVYLSDDDMEVEFGEPSTSTKHRIRLASTSRSGSSDRAIVNDEAIVLTDSDSEQDFEQPFESPSRSPNNSPQKDDMAWLIEDDEDVDLDIVNSSPITSRRLPAHVDDAQINDSIEFVDEADVNSAVDDSIEFVDDRPSERALSPPPPSQMRNSWFSSEPKNSPRPSGSRLYKRSTASNRLTEMLPPSLPAHVTGSSPLTARSPQAPEPSFAVRPVGKKRAVVLRPDSSPIAESPVQKRRIHRRRDSSDKPKERHAKKKKLPHIRAKDNPLYDYAAEHSGDEVSEGSSSNSEDDVESESDRQFLKELPETQLSPSYNQTQAYRQSLLTQAPGKGPMFANKPTRRGRFGRYSMRGNQRRAGVSSSPPRDEEEPDMYEFDSFVVDDDAEISYES